MAKNLYMRETSKGLTVKINLWSLEKYPDFNAEKARLWIKGQVTNGDESRESKIFNDAGELISILGKWNVAKLKQLRKKKK